MPVPTNCWGMDWLTIHPSNHPSILCVVFVVGSLWQQGSSSSPDILIPSNIFLFLLEDPEAFPTQIRYLNLHWGVLPVGISQKPSKGRGPGGSRSETEPPLLIPFKVKKQWLYSELQRVSDEKTLRWWRTVANFCHLLFYFVDEKPFTTISSWKK